MPSVTGLAGAETIDEGFPVDRQVHLGRCAIRPSPKT